MTKLKVLAAFALTVLLTSGPAYSAGKSFKWASQDDATTMDPHAFNHGMTMTVAAHIYEGLIRRNKDMQIEPSLAVSWTQAAPTQWRFKLRGGVKFHDGATFSAEDVVFSIQRAMQPTSDMKIFAASITEVVASASDEVTINTAFPNSALLQSLPELKIMSRAWAERHGAQTPADMRKAAENYATRNANGTGPFRLDVRDPDIRTVLKANTAWWDKPQHNIETATLVRIANDATRVAALLSGEVDFAYPIPLQDIARVNQQAGLKVLQGPEIRTMFIALDVSRDELVYSDVKGKNPLKDRRVRQALYQAIDIDAITKRILRGSGTPTGNLMAPGINGVSPDLQKRPYDFDIAAAKKLLTDAGYPNGFGITLDCPNDRYVNDEQVCQAAASMLARVDVKVSVNAMPAAKFFPKVGARDTSMAFFGYSPVNLDAYNTLNVIVATPDGKGGQWNVGNYSSPAADEAIRNVLSEMDPAKRTAWVSKAIEANQKDVGHIPLYQQGLSWGMKKSIDVPLQIDNRVNLGFMMIN